MKRREFIALLGGIAAWSIPARAQQPVLPVIGFLNGGSPNGFAPLLAAFHTGLNETKFVEGQNVLIEYRWADDHYDRLPALAADLVRRQVTVIAANTPAVPAAKAATSTIPIVFTTAKDPVASGYVVSLNQPGGNLTGVATLSVEIGSKRLELLHELIPTATTMGLLINPTNPNAESQLKEIHASAQALGLQLRLLNATTEQDIEEVFTTLSELRVGALIIAADVLFVDRSKELASLALRYGLPAISITRDFVVDGGLMSYGAGLVAPYRLMGVYTGRVLAGEKPANLPVQQATKIDLYVNLKTAKTLVVTVPLALSGRADELFE